MNKNKLNILFFNKDIEYICGFIGKWAAILMTCYHLYTSMFGLPSAKQHRAIHLEFAIIIAFMTIPLTKGNKKRKFIFIDIFLALLATISLLYVVNQYVAIAYRAGSPTQWDIILGIITIMIILEFARRVVGIQLLIVPILFILYLLFGQYIPGYLGHRAYSLSRIINTLFLSTDGIFGAPLGASSMYVAVFVILGSIFELTGLGQFFINFAYSLTGRLSSGPAQTAVVASGLFGMISGSPSANVVTTGTFTIPLMKSIGYKAEDAGAIEALSSVGGQIMPPIMGASAFLIAELLEIPYIRIISAAFIPAFLYYISASISVHLKAKKIGIVPNLEGIRNPIEILKKGWYFLIPLSVLLFLLIFVRYSPYKSAIICIFVSIFIAKITKNPKINLKYLLNTFEISSKRLITIVSACAAAGIVIGVVTLTGMGLKISILLMDISHGNLLIALIITQITAMIMGMGLPTVAAYITTSVLLAPALVEMGVPLLLAHMFVFYGAIVSNLTPPVCIASYVAAGIAKSDPWRTAIAGFLLGIPGPYLVPYIFIYHPVLMFVNNSGLIEIIGSFIVGVLAVTSLAIGINRYCLIYLKWYESVIAIIVSIMLVIPNIILEIIAIIIFCVLIITQVFRLKQVSIK